MTVKYEDYKQFKSDVNIQFGDAVNDRNKDKEPETEAQLRRRSPRVCYDRAQWRRSRLSTTVPIRIEGEFTIRDPEGREFGLAGPHGDFALPLRPFAKQAVLRRHLTAAWASRTPSRPANCRHPSRNCRTVLPVRRAAVLILKSRSSARLAGQSSRIRSISSLSQFAENRSVRIISVAQCDRLCRYRHPRAPPDRAAAHPENSLSSRAPCARRRRC